MGSVITNYTLEGDNVVYETNGTDKMWYYYDASGAPVSFELNGTSYHYVKNLQGDVIAIVNDSGAKVVEYKYNSWGKLLSTTGSLAGTIGVKNPYRYRGYRYDPETGLYYLQSRYYDPETGRFINADSSVDTGDTVLSTNMFAYCENNAVNCVDYNGNAKSYIKSLPGNMRISSEVSSAIKAKGLYKNSTFMKKVGASNNITKYYYLISKSKGFFGSTNYTVIIYSVKTMTNSQWASYLNKTYRVYFNYLKNNDYISEFVSAFCEASGNNKVNILFNLVNEAIKHNIIIPKEISLYYKAAKNSKGRTVSLVKGYSVVGYTIDKRGKTKNYVNVAGRLYY